MLIGKVPIDLIRYKVELADPSKLKTADVISLLSSSISFEDSAKARIVLMAKCSPAPSAGSASYTRPECTHCRDTLKKPHPKYLRPREHCYAQFPRLYEEDKRRREKFRKGKQPRKTAALAHEEAPVSVDSTIDHLAEEIETCFLSSVSASRQHILTGVDSGCTISVVPDFSILKDYVASTGNFITVGDGSKLPFESVVHRYGWEEVQSQQSAPCTRDDFSSAIGPLFYR